MGIMENIIASSQNGASSASAPNPGTGRPPKPTVNSAGVAQRENPSQIWLNVAMRYQGRLINLPFGLAIDSMKYIELKGNNQEWIDFNDLRNGVLEMLQLKGAAMAPGTTEELPVGLEEGDFTIQILRVGEKKPPAAADRNALMATLAAKLAPKAPEAPPQG